jgi:hypothetical protein
VRLPGGGYWMPYSGKLDFFPGTAETSQSDKTWSLGD